MGKRTRKSATSTPTQSNCATLSATSILQYERNPNEDQPVVKMTDFSYTAHTDKAVLDRYMRLPQPDDKIMATYIWIDGTGEHVRAKTRTIDFVPKTPSELPMWNYDGSSTDQAEGSNSDTFLYPVAIYRDPFNLGNNRLVLCDTHKYNKKPTDTNPRAACLEAMQAVGDQEPWNGAGAHCNFSTKAMREEGGIAAIEKAIEKLSVCHEKHIKAYDPHEGKDNERRLTGQHETSSIHDFSAGVANRGCSIRVPRSVAEERKDYLEDRRPASNADPYQVTNVIVRTTCLDQ